MHPPLDWNDCSLSEKHQSQNIFGSRLLNSKAISIWTAQVTDQHKLKKIKSG